MHEVITSVYTMAHRIVQTKWCPFPSPKQGKIDSEVATIQHKIPRECEKVTIKHMPNSSAHIEKINYMSCQHT